MKKRKPRVWLWTPARTLGVFWVVELAEGKYLRLDTDGKHLVYESPATPPHGAFGWGWEELT